MSVKPTIATVIATTAGTAVRVNAAVTSVTSVYLETLAANVGTIYVGLSNVSSSLYMCALSASKGFNLSAGGNFGGFGSEIDLSSLWVVGSNSGDKIQVTYLTRVGTGI